MSRSGLAREEVHLTTKLKNGFHRPADARSAFEQSLADLGTDYVSTWNTLIEFASDGRDPHPGLVSDRLGRTPSQVTLRWHAQRGDVVSGTVSRW